MNRKTASFLIVLFFLITYILPIVIISKEENLYKKEGLDILRNPNIDNDFVAIDGGIADRDLNRNGSLGIAKYFHIFANNVTLSADVSGNIATGRLKANSNFGTKIHESKLNLDISYIQDVEFIQSSSFISANSNRKNKVIFGENVTLKLVDNGNKVAANNCKLDHLSKDEIYQDKNGCKYIDFNNEFKNLKKSSDEMKIEKQTIGVVKNFTDENNRYFDVSNIQSSEKGAVILNKTDESGNKLDGVKFNLYKEGERTPIKTNLTTNNGKIIVLNLDEGNYKFKEVETLKDYILDSSEHKFTISSYNIGSSNTIYLELTKEEIEKARPITIKGIDKNGPNIIVNVDTENSKNINVCAEIKLIYSDGTERNNHETEDFSDAQVLWNFINRANDQVININQARFQGSILAVGSTINIGQNVDGCIIADTVNINGGESHRWDFQEKNGSNKKDVELTLVNKKKDPDNSLYSIRLIKLDSTYLPYSVSTSLVKS